MRPSPRTSLLVALASAVAVAACPSTRGDGASPKRFAAADFVTDAPYGGLVLEVDAVVEERPADAVLEATHARLFELVEAGAVEKPDGIAFTIDEELPPLGDPDRPWTFDELEGLARAHRNLFPGEGVAVIHMLVVDGRYEGDDGDGLVLGLAWGGDTLALFSDNIARACESAPAVQLLAPALAEEVCRRTTATVLLHEVGHLLGLVNNGAPMQVDHQDEAHGAHDVDEDCIMYWAAERSRIADVIAERVAQGGAEQPSFDQACLDDLKALAASR